MLLHPAEVGEFLHFQEKQFLHWGTIYPVKKEHQLLRFSAFKLK